MKLILSIDGGGIRGIVPATVLARLEYLLGQPAGQVFDLISGTSTGGIIACALGAGVPAKQMVDIYSKRGAEIFNRSLFRFPAFQPKYSAEGLERVLFDVFGYAEFRSSMTKLLIPAYDMILDQPFHFKSWKSIFGVHHTDVARATSAAPTYFALAAARFIDGGVFANNPALNAFAEAERLWPTDDVFMLSLGTGFKPGQRKPVKRGGLLDWMRPILDLALDGPPRDVEYMAAQLLGNRHIRITGELPASVNGAMDDVSPANILALQVFADDLVTKGSNLGRFVKAAQGELASRGAPFKKS